MNFAQAVSSGFKNCATFSGRATRSEYWYWVLFVGLFYFTLGGIATEIPDFELLIDNMPIILNLILNLIIFIFFLVTNLAGLTVSIRRLHDVGRSGWWLLITLTGIGCLVILYWHLKPSKQEGNRY